MYFLGKRQTRDKSTRKRLVAALVVFALVAAAVSVSADSSTPVVTDVAKIRRSFVVTADYVGLLFDGQIPVIEEGDGYLFTVVVDGETVYEWKDGDPALTEDEIARVWQILETSGIYRMDSTDNTEDSDEAGADVQAMGNAGPDYSCATQPQRPSVTAMSATAEVSQTCFGEDVWLHNSARIWTGA